MKKRLNLCEGHKQEWKQSHYAEHNCDYCKLLKEHKEVLTKLRALEDVKAPELNTTKEEDQ